MGDFEVSVILTLMFNDLTSRNITFSGISEDDFDQATVREKVKEINANMPAAFSRTFVSNDGASCIRISNAKAVAVSEEVIYNAS